MHSESAGSDMRRLFTTDEALRRGLTKAALRWGEHTGRWCRIERGVYGEGPEAPTALDRALAAALATGGVASGQVAGVLLGLDGVEVGAPDVTVSPRRNGRRDGVRRRELDPERVITVEGI